ncbi:MAG: hypothetical protein FGM24_08925 [Candidatus Kapabacteria bacterium]|nr:hypothetical protein [Candidatus Kapabacteria bacterium]
MVKSRIVLCFQHHQGCMRRSLFTIGILLTVSFCRVSASNADSSVPPPIPVVHVAGHGGQAKLPDTVHAVVHYKLTHDVPFVDLHIQTEALHGDAVHRHDVEYRAMVEPYGGNWMTVSDHRLRLSNLGSGTHTIRLQARYPGMAWGKEVHVQLDVEQSPLSTLSTYAMFGVAMLLSSWGVAKTLRHYREQRLLKDERIRLAERRRIARDLHDDVNAGLARIVVLSDAVAAQREAQDAAATIAETAREVIDNVRSIVWVMKSDDDSASGLMAYVRQKIGELLEDHGIEFVYAYDGCSDLRLSTDVRWNVLMCIKEIAMNIIRHSGAQTVFFTVSCIEGYLNVRICDDGVGFESSRTESAGGLAHIRARMADIGGTAGIGSRPGQGTKILLVIPVRADNAEGNAQPPSNDEEAS